MTNLWTRYPLTHNPYYRTAFRLAGVPRETTSRRTLVMLIGQTRQMVRAAAQAHTVHGTPVSDAELNPAEAILLDPKQRISEELLTHATERLPLDLVRKLAQEAAAALQAEGAGRLPVDNLSGLQGWTRSLAQQFLEQTPAPPPSLGALELTVVPPFGQPAGR